MKLGDLVKDVVTGFRGVAVSRMECLDGRILLEVQPTVRADGSLPSALYISEAQLATVKSDKIPDAAPTSIVEERLAKVFGDEVVTITGTVEGLGQSAPDRESDKEDAVVEKKKRAPKKTAAKADAPKAAEPEIAEEDESDDFAAPPVTKAKPAKKLTEDDCNNACRELMRRLTSKLGSAKIARGQVLDRMKNKFNIASVHELDESQFENFITEMSAE